MVFSGIALLSLVWTPHDPSALNIRHKLQGPSWTHWMGTDSLGRDLLSQWMAGARSTLAGGALAVLIGASVGTGFGCWAAARGGRVDTWLMRASDFGFAFPALITALLLTSLVGPGLQVSIAAIAVFNVPVFARLVRGAAQALWAREFVRAAQALGVGAARITWRHVLPNLSGLLIVQLTVAFATAVLAEAALSYLGLGTQPPTPSWGRMLADAQAQLFQAPWLAVPPGAAIMGVVLGLNLLGDGLRDALDPRLN
jgi:peptide/nickel transport system permease protein